MKQIVTWTLITLFGWLGWVMGEPFGLMAALVLGMIGSGVGMFLGGWLARTYG
jgi:uncharacterized membrane protein YeaQ/YmgE (transglycosylase-associated protein family)